MIGQNLATLEAIVAIIFLLRRYKFTLAPGQDITYRTGLTMPMKNGMQVFVEKLPQHNSIATSFQLAYMIVISYHFAINMTNKAFYDLLWLHTSSQTLVAIVCIL